MACTTGKCIIVVHCVILSLSYIRLCYFMNQALRYGHLLLMLVCASDASLFPDREYGKRMEIRNAYTNLGLTLSLSCIGRRQDAVKCYRVNIHLTRIIISPRCII